MAFWVLVHIYSLAEKSALRYTYGKYLERMRTPMFKKLQKSLFALTLFALPLSASSKQTVEQTHVVVIGGGVGALTSAIYLERAGIHATVMEGPNPGGAIIQSSQVQNWPGEVDIEGKALIDKIRHQAEINGADLLSQEVVSVDFSQKPFKICTREVSDRNKIHTLYATSCIIATGSTPRLLEVPGEKKYWTRGVYTCATCDGALFKNKTVAVIGGGDTAILEAEHLANLAKKVLLVVRKADFRAIEARRKKALLKRENVEVRFQTVVEAIQGDEKKVTHLVLNQSGHLETMAVDGIFLAIGSTPNSRLFEGQLELDAAGYILTNSHQTSLEGVFAIGDVVDPVYKQAISAAGDGAKAALDVEKHLSVLSLPVLEQKKPDSFTTQPVSATTSSKKLTLPVRASEPGIIELRSTNQLREELASSSIPVVIDFYSVFCGPCHKAAQLLEEAARTFEGKIKFIKINVSDFSDLATKYDVFAVPTMILFGPGSRELQRATGIDEIEVLVAGLGQFRPAP